jgi:GNAT superfamily N-acetyltransferase
MQGPYRTIEITDDSGAVLEPQWLARAEPVHRQLRTRLPGDYPGKMRRVFAGGGRMIVVTHGEDVHGLAVWRIHENTFAGVHMYVDDLVSDDSQRSRGIGRTLMQWLEERARARDCTNLVLDSGTQRRRAHRFYFREGMYITSFNFKKALDGSDD